MKISVKAYTALYTADAIYVSRTGAWWIGRKQIERQHRLAIRTQLRGSRLRLRAESINLLTPLIALVHADVQLKSLEITRAMATFLLKLVHREGWRIIAAHTSERSLE